MSNMENLLVKDETRSREEWIRLADLPDPLKEKVLAADVLIVPSMMPAQPKAFMVGTMDLCALFKEQLKDRFEICISDEDYEEIELNSRTLRLGKFLVKSVALQLFLGIVGDYIYDRIKDANTPDVAIEMPEYQQPAIVTFSIAVEDTTGKTKNFHYEGPAADYKMVAAEIERIWNEE